MRSILPTCAVVAVIAFAAPAEAQYGNNGLALSSGYFAVSEDESIAVDSAIPVGLEGTRYLDSGFETYLRFQAMFLRESVSDQLVVGVAPALGIRYLFNEEDIRPYVGVDLSYLHIFGGTNGLVVDRAGPGVNAGVDFFVAESVTLGVRGQGALYVALNRSPYFSYGMSAVAATYF